MRPINLHDYQRYAKDFLLKTPSAALFLEMGLGKACDDNTILPTPSGQKRLGDVQVGEKIFGQDGKPTTVLAVYKHKQKEAYQIFLEDGRSFICCDEHLIAHYAPNNKTLTISPLKEILPYYQQKKAEDPLYAIPNNQAVEYPEKKHAISSFIVGAILGGNSLAERNIPKRIANEYLEDSVENRKNLLRGILTNIFIPMTSDFADDICLLGRSLGFHAMKNQYNEVTLFHPKTNEVWNHPFSGIYMKEDDEKTKQIQILGIRTVEKRDMTCLTVDNKDHLFLINDYIVTHNTLITLSALYELNPNGNVLIIAPKNIARSTWLDEVEKWQIPIRIKSLITDEKGKDLSRKKRLATYETIKTAKPSVYLINQELVTDLIEYFSPKFPFPVVVIDEFQGFKSHSSKRFHALKKVRPQIKRLIGLTGTPTPNSLMDLWSEIYLLDQGKRLGRTISDYRDLFFLPGLIVNNHPVSWYPRYGAKKEIYRRIGDIVISMENNKLKLPKLTINTIYVHLSDKEKALYQTMAKEQVLNLGEEEITANNAAVLTGKLAQMASGAIYTDENGNFTPIHERKLIHLTYMLQNIQEPTLVAYYFQSDQKMILSYLKKQGINACVFDGSREMIQAWNQKKIKVLLIQPLSAGHGLNLQEGGSTLIWYTLPWSLEAYLQTNARLYRQGQKKPVVIHHLLTKDTIDDYILKKLHKKDTSQKELLDAVKATLNDLKNP